MFKDEKSRFVQKKYEKYGEGFLYFLNPLINILIPGNERDSYKKTLIEILENYTFKKRSKNDPLHSESIEYLGGEIEIDFERFRNPEDTAKALIAAMGGFYQSETQERIKKYLIKNL